MSSNRSEFDPHKYWDQRHEAYDQDLRDVGDKRISSQENSVQLIAKAAHIAWLLGRLGVNRNANLLDAGCGKGYITEILSDVGFRCTGVDVSECAIQNSRPHSAVNYQVASLEDLNLDEEFEVIVCADVLYHVVDEQRWSRAVSNLYRHLLDGGVLIVVEAFHSSSNSAPHVQWRSLDDYQRLTNDVGGKLEVLDDFEERFSGETKTILEIIKPNNGSASH